MMRPWRAQVLVPLLSCGGASVCSTHAPYWEELTFSCRNSASNFTVSALPSRDIKITHF